MYNVNKIFKLATDTSDYKLGEIIRYNGKQKIKQESVSEHSFMAALNIIKVAKMLNIDNNTTYKAVTMAVLHDISEVYIGDITYDFKSEPDNKEILDKLFDNYENKLYNNIYKNSIGEIYKEMIDKSDPIADRLVKLADSMSVLQYATREKQYGNRHDDILQIETGAIKRIGYDYARLIQELED